MVDILSNNISNFSKKLLENIKEVNKDSYKEKNNYKKFIKYINLDTDKFKNFIFSLSNNEYITFNNYYIIQEYIDTYKNIIYNKKITTSSNTIPSNTINTNNLLSIQNFITLLIENMNNDTNITNLVYRTNDEFNIKVKTSARTLKINNIDKISNWLVINQYIDEQNVNLNIDYALHKSNKQLQLQYVFNNITHILFNITIIKKQNDLWTLAIDYNLPIDFKHTINPNLYNDIGIFIDNIETIINLL